ncbi:MAG: hypothetical protein H7A25_07470 [Leptospiraceae bacterium]|nr:hypothetical protein [Leptospiraceae bacterium]
MRQKSVAKTLIHFILATASLVCLFLAAGSEWLTYLWWGIFSAWLLVMVYFFRELKKPVGGSLKNP